MKIVRPPDLRYKAGERGSREFKSRIVRKEGTIMTMARREVVTISAHLQDKGCGRAHG
jgi:hypothetical protein